MTDNQLFAALFDKDPAIAAVAKRIYDAKYTSEPKMAEPPHCLECFEGCDKCR